MSKFNNWLRALMGFEEDEVFFMLHPNIERYSSAPHTNEVLDQCRERAKQVFEAKVRDRAYYLWESAGCPDDDGCQFWFEAEKQEQEQFVGIG